MKTLAVAATAALIVMGSVNAAEPPPLTQATRATQPTTKELYGSMCQACHGVDGKSPLKEMAFAGREWKHGTKAADMIRIITNGVPGTVMLPFKGRLTEAQIRDLARFVRALDRKLPPERKM